MEETRIEKCPRCCGEGKVRRLTFAAGEWVSQGSVVRCAACGARYVPCVGQTILYGIGACLATFLIHFGTLYSVAAIAILEFFLEPQLRRNGRWRRLREDTPLETQEYLLPNILALGATLLLLPIAVFLVVLLVR